NANSPRVPDVIVRSSEVASLMRVRVAPGTTCPVLSIMVPEMVPVFWAAAGAASNNVTRTPDNDRPGIDRRVQFITRHLLTWAVDGSTGERGACDTMLYR